MCVYIYIYIYTYIHVYMSIFMYSLYAFFSYFHVFSMHAHPQMPRAPHIKAQSRDTTATWTLAGHCSSRGVTFGTVLLRQVSCVYRPRSRTFLSQKETRTNPKGRHTGRSRQFRTFILATLEYKSPYGCLEMRPKYSLRRMRPNYAPLGPPKYLYPKKKKSL